MKGKIRNFVMRAWRWLKDNRFEATLLIIILLLGGILRLYKISEYMTFLGDEGRDVIIVRRLLVNFDPILIGPGTSVGNMYLGPIYYYMIAPFLLLFNFSPVGPSVFIALLGIITIGFVWYVSRKWFGKIAAFVSALVYSVSPVVIYFARSSWNPNIMPFFSLLTIYSIWKIWYEKNWKWLLVSGISLSIVLQSHYLGLLLMPVLLIFWYLSIKQVKTDPLHKSEPVRYTLVSIFLFILLMSPLFIFDARHGWRNISALKNFLSSGSGNLQFGVLDNFIPLVVNLNTRLLAGGSEIVGKIVFILFMFSLIATIAYWKRFSKKVKGALILIITWIFFGIFGLSIYNQPIYDHYLGFIFAAIFIYFGGICQLLYQEKKFFGIIFIPIFCVLLIVTNISNNAFRHPPNRQMDNTISVARKIAEESKGEKFNLAVIAERNYEGAYQYFLEAWNAPFVMIDPQRYQETVADQLFVVCEYEEIEKCQPTSNPKPEVANFGWSKIDKEWDISGVKLYKLLHNNL
jgi:4-amino-4-deoxy-L-arabinose transferase-like glycosyltransferase